MLDAARSPTPVLALGAPRYRIDSTDVGDAQVLLLDVLDRLGRAAAAVRRDGRVIHLNQKARMLAGDGFATTRQHLRATQPDSQEALETAIQHAFTGPRTCSAALERSRGSAPLLVRVMPMNSTAPAEGAALLLFTDPTARRCDDVTGLLQLIGLTLGQARVAAIVGGGSSPKEAARLLSISENTVRSTLKSIYGKLGVNRQSELALIIARLQSC